MSFFHFGTEQGGSNENMLFIRIKYYMVELLGQKMKISSVPLFMILTAKCWSGRGPCTKPNIQLTVNPARKLENIQLTLNCCRKLDKKKIPPPFFPPHEPPYLLSQAQFHPSFAAGFCLRWSASPAMNRRPTPCPTLRDWCRSQLYNMMQNIKLTNTLLQLQFQVKGCDN